MWPDPYVRHMQCNVCQSWRLLEDDLYCSWCGATLLDLDLSLDVPYLYVGDPPGPLALTVKHAGAFGAIKLERVESDQQWLKVETGRLPRALEEVLLRHGEQLIVPLKGDAQHLPDDYHLARLTVHSSVGARDLTLQAAPKPKLDKVSTGGDHIVLLDNLRDERLTGYLAIARGVVTVDELRTDVSWATAQPVNNAPPPYLLDARGNNRLEFAFSVDERLLLQDIMSVGGKFPVDKTGNLIVKYSRLEPERIYPFHIKCFLPPMLRVPQDEAGGIKLEVFTGQRGELELTLQNGDSDETGRADLRIEEIKCDAPWLQPTSQIAYPLVIRSGQFQQVTFSANAEGLAEDSHHAKFTFLTNTPGPDRQKDIFIEVEVKRLAEFEGVVAIDFGTTNSCCAFLSPLGRSGLIPIDDDQGSQTPTVASSTILYNDLFETGKYYEIGSRAYSVSFDPAYSYSAVRQVKRRLGRTDPYKIRFRSDLDKWAHYLPREVAADILRRILEKAEQRLKSKIRSCTISHPSRFSLRQIDDLKAALISCGIEEGQITTVHEPVGAALHFIRQDEALDGYEKYHLMVYDMGGGTTDITLLRVANVRQPGGITTIVPEVLGTTGDPRLGGEDVTDSVMLLMHQKCEKVLREKHPAATTCVVPFDAKSFTDPRRKSLAQENRNSLRRLAEAVKIAVSAHGEEHREVLRKNPLIDGVNYSLKLPEQFTLAAIVDNEIKPAELFQYVKCIPRRAEIDEATRPRLDGVVELMKRLAGNNGVKAPEVILLTGKSSALPVVRSVIQEAFKESKLVMPPDSKECVVRGACQLSDETPEAKVSVQFEQKSHLGSTTSRLGISVNEAGRHMFHQLIDAGVPIGEGIRVKIERVQLKNRRTRINILENTSAVEDKLSINDEDNRNIEELKSFKLESRLVEWERAHGRVISDQEIRSAEIELHLTPKLALRLVAKIPGITEEFEFEAEYGGW
jgi:molecular chaperone DnaK (HSP70)